MPRKGNRRKKTRTHVTENENVRSALSSAEDLKVPRSLVIRRGKVESEVQELVDDLRKLMLPNTALHFKEDAKNRKMTLGHYAKELALPMGITHILSFSQKGERLNMRLARTPAGPTLSFRAHQFSLSRHVRSIQRRPFSSEAAFHNPPVVVTNNFGDATAPPHVKLMRITFQNMFPAINVATVKLADCRRVVLFHLMTKTTTTTDDEGNEIEKETQMVEMRHYAIKASPVGVDRKVRRLIQTKIPNLNRLNDIADYITGTTATGEVAPSAATASGNASDSEPEDETSHVVLPQTYTGRGNKKNQKSALKLVELGPRLCLELVKVERDLGGGDVMYHAHVTKSTEEVRELKAKREKEASLKVQRREEQERNVERKRRAKEEKLERKKQRRAEREQINMEELRRGEQEESGTDDDGPSSDEEQSEHE
mmetsp:Transcript_25810/g.36403  ORF Transcript_25810/g.36403 Transcript_25810/m.36403 type:complete len:426 (-) Transcript_25810:96-1373(-)